MTTRRTIPEIRERLLELARKHGLPELAELAEETRRRYHGRHAPTRAIKITPALRERVRDYAQRHPKMHMRLIGQHFGIDQGRVSEILFGKRGEA